MKPYADHNIEASTPSRWKDRQVLRRAIRELEGHPPALAAEVR
jgi:hypothetical protein